MNKELEKIKRYIFIDFETANRSYSSACQIAFDVIESEKVVYRYNSLIKPQPNYFIPYNKTIHHIDETLVENEPTFDQIWPKISNWFTDQSLVIAHNVEFDMHVLKSLLKQYNLFYNPFNYCDSILVVRKLTNNSFISYSLANLTKRYDIHFHHHDASEDCRVIYEIFYNFNSSIEETINLALNKGLKMKKFLVE